VSISRSDRRARVTAGSVLEAFANRARPRLPTAGNALDRLDMDAGRLTKPD
jgi:hypothetical protein